MEEVLEVIEEVTDVEKLAAALKLPTTLNSNAAAERRVREQSAAFVTVGKIIAWGLEMIGGGTVNKQEKEQLIDYWLQTSPDPSWTALAKAVERMGGHDELAKKLKHCAEQKKT